MNMNISLQPESQMTLDQLERMQFISGDFTPSEANDLFSYIIHGNVNFYKLQRLMQCESNHETDGKFCDSKVEELVKKKKELKKIIAHARENGLKLSVGGVLEVKLVK